VGQDVPSEELALEGDVAFLFEDGHGKQRNAQDELVGAVAGDSLLGVLDTEFVG